MPAPERHPGHPQCQCPHSRNQTRESKLATSFTILFYGPEQTLVRLQTVACADLADALRLASTDCGDCTRIVVYSGGRTLWKGSPIEARFAAGKVVGPC